MRTIGISHRVKRTAVGKTRPTLVAILDDGKTTEYKLTTEQDELDFALGAFPTAFRKVEPTDSLAGIAVHQIKWRKAKDESRDNFPDGHTRSFEKTFEVADSIPTAFDGLRPGDTVAMMLGGSGDCLAYALARMGEDIGVRVIRIPPFKLKQEREKAGIGGPVRFGDAVENSIANDEDGAIEATIEEEPLAEEEPDESTEQDHFLLTRLATEEPKLFYQLAARDRELIITREAWRALNEAMKARMACALRLRQSFIGRIFTAPDGLFPEGGIEKRFDEVKASDIILNALEEEESRRMKELVKALENLPVYREVFKPIEGVGPKIAARIIAAIADIRRFETMHQLKAFCGVHVLPDGRFPRRRRSEVANWHPDARQALYLLVEQFNRRPNTYWGQDLLDTKKRLKETHPEPELVEVKGEKGGRKVKRWTKGHIHKTALWRTATRFVEHLHGQWTFFDTGVMPDKNRQLLPERLERVLKLKKAA